MRELSLEFEAKQPARGRMHRLSSGGSQLEHRRTSSSSTIGGLESGTASPTLSLRLPTVLEPEQQASPAGVPLLRLPSRASGAVGAADPTGSTSTPGVQLPPGISSRGMAVPRLNLGLARSVPSPGGQSSPSPGNSARHGRPPLPPSARSGMGATPRLTSRLGRTMSARSSDLAASVAATAAAAAPPQLPSTQQASSGAAPRLSAASNGSSAPSGGGASKPGIPKLGLAGIGRSLGGAAPSEQPAGSGAAALPARPPGAEGRPGRVHFSPTPSRQAPSEAGSDSEGSSTSDGSSSSSDDDEDEDEGPTAAGRRSSEATSRLTPAGFDVPAGFTFTGDLEEDLERLEALEDQVGREGGRCSRFEEDGPKFLPDLEHDWQRCGQGGACTCMPAAPAFLQPFSRLLSQSPAACCAYCVCSSTAGV